MVIVDRWPSGMHTAMIKGLGKFIVVWWSINAVGVVTLIVAVAWFDGVLERRSRDGSNGIATSEIPPDVHWYTYHIPRIR